MMLVVLMMAGCGAEKTEIPAGTLTFVEEKLDLSACAECVVEIPDDAVHVQVQYCGDTWCQPAGYDWRAKESTKELVFEPNEFEVVVSYFN